MDQCNCLTGDCHGIAEVTESMLLLAPSAIPLKGIVTEYSMPRKAKLTIRTVRVRKVKVTEKKHPEPKSPPKPEPEPQEKPKAPVAEPMAAPLPEHTQKRPIGEWPLQPGHRYA